MFFADGETRNTEHQRYKNHPVSSERGNDVLDPGRTHSPNQDQRIPIED